MKQRSPSVTSADPQRPGDQRADTTMMGVVHDAIRRDLHRLHDTLATQPGTPLEDTRRHALCDHVDWMMDFLNRHHRSEDDGLWPLVLARAPGTAPLLDRMGADHRHIVPAMQTVGSAVRAYRENPGQQAGLASALHTLRGALLPHLRREEDDAMPVVSATLTNRDWRSWDKRYNVRGKSLTQLAMDGHWLMDQLDRQRYQTLVHLVPLPARLIIVKASPADIAGRARSAGDLTSSSRPGPSRQLRRGLYAARSGSACSLWLTRMNSWCMVSPEFDFQAGGG
jgi:hypothetical protein